MTNNIGLNIKKKRTYLKLTLADVASKVGVSRQTVQKYESGVISNIPSDKIELLARALGVSPAYLMGWEDSYSIESADLHLKMSDDKKFQDLYFYWEQLSEIGQNKLMDNAADLSKIYNKEL